MTPRHVILASPRVAEIKAAAAELSAAGRRPPASRSPATWPRDRPRLLALLVHQRRRNAKLVELLQV